MTTDLHFVACLKEDGYVTIMKKVSDLAALTLSIPPACAWLNDNNTVKMYCITHKLASIMTISLLNRKNIDAKCAWTINFKIMTATVCAMLLNLFSKQILISLHESTTIHKWSHIQMDSINNNKENNYIHLCN